MERVSQPRMVQQLRRRWPVSVVEMQALADKRRGRRDLVLGQDVVVRQRFFDADGRQVGDRAYAPCTPCQL